MANTADRRTRVAADPMDSAVFNAEIGAAVQERLAGSNYGTLVAERGVPTVALNENGEIVEHRPKASSVALPSKCQTRDA
jgi:hypothetical protein